MIALMKKSLFAALVLGLMAGYVPVDAWAGTYSDSKKHEAVKKDSVEKKDSADSDANVPDDSSDDAAPDAVVED